MYLLVVGIPQDAYRSFTGTCSDDRWRLFNYYRAVRYEGVPAALLKHGISPGEDVCSLE